MCDTAAGYNTAGVLNQAHTTLGQSTAYGEWDQQLHASEVHAASTM
jgi:hypothetical protein